MFPSICLTICYHDARTQIAQNATWFKAAREIIAKSRKKDKNKLCFEL